MQTLADLQIERERLRSEAARQDYDHALAETIHAEDLRHAASGVRGAMLDAVAQLTDRLALAIEGEQDETRIHYLLSDAAHDVLREIGDKVTGLPHAEVIGQAVRRGIKPRDLLTVSQWADRHRWLASGTNAPGQWRTDRTPYLREIMDSLSEHSEVRTVSFIKSSGVGGTEVMFNWIGYIMGHLQNKDTLLVVPTLELRDRSFSPRLSKMLDETPSLKEIVHTGKRSNANRADLIEYGARARIIKAGANSPDSLRSEHLPYVIADEIDAFPWDVGGEGDPLTLIDNRQRTFTRAKTFLVSTPTIDGQSRIDQQYQRSDQRRYHVPCPHCGEFHHLEFKSLQWKTQTGEEAEQEGRAPTVIDAWMACPHCGGMIEEGHKTEMLLAGHWVPQRPHIKKHRGYHLNAFYAPVGLGLSWREVAQKWLEAQGDTSKLKSFINTSLGEVWREQGEGIEDIALMARLEAYTPEELGISLITAGVDVQKDRIEVSVVGWGREEEAWLFDHEILAGDPADPAVWSDLHTYLLGWSVDHAAVDEGYLTQMVREFIAKRAWCWPVKGMPGMNRPLIDDERRRRQRLRARRKKGIPTEPIGVDQAKTILLQRLRLEAAGPRYIHFPNSAAFDEEYFAQLAAEKLVQKRRGHRVFSEWVKVRARNEAIDCLVYAFAAMRLSGKTLDTPRNPGQGKGATSSTSTSTSKQKPQKPTPGRGLARSDWSKRL